MISTQALLDEACPLIARAGAAFYFTPETIERAKAMGLDGYRFYFLGRGGVLGDVEAPVVASAFGYFEPGLLAHMWNTAREKVAPREAGRAHLGCAHDMGRARLVGIDGLDAFCDAAAAVVSAAEPAGLALFAGMLAEPVPDDHRARAMHLLVVLRELRGSAHLLAVRASGLSPRVAHYLKRPDDFALFGWKEADVPTVGEGEPARMASAEALTDELVAPAYSVLGDAARAAFIDGLRKIAPALRVERPAPGTAR